MSGRANISLGELRKEVTASVEDRLAALEISSDRQSLYLQTLILDDAAISNAALNPDRICALILMASTGRAITDFMDRRALSTFARQLPALLRRAGDLPPEVAG